MLEGDAEFRSAQMAVDIKRGLAYNAEHCMVTGAIPFGYRRTKDYTLELDPDRAPLVKEIYDRFLSGWKIIDIANDLNRRGITTAKREALGPEQLSPYVVQRTIHRRLHLRRHTHPGGLPAIIDRDTWLAVQRRLHTRKIPWAGRGHTATICSRGSCFAATVSGPWWACPGRRAQGSPVLLLRLPGPAALPRLPEAERPAGLAEEKVCAMVAGLVMQDDVVEWMADCGWTTSAGTKRTAPFRPWPRS